MFIFFKQELYNISALEHPRAFILGKYVLLGYINIINQKKGFLRKKNKAAFRYRNDENMLRYRAHAPKIDP